MNGPCRHLTWSELACTNHLHRAFDGIAHGCRIAPYPQLWRDTRAVHLADTFEAIRECLGNEPIAVNSAYRTAAYNRAIGGAAGSQHLQGKALDIAHPTVKARELFAILVDMQKQGKLPQLGGLGSYATFVHIDVRDKVAGRLAVWHQG